MFGPAFAMDSTPVSPMHSVRRNEACRSQSQREDSQEYGGAGEQQQERRAWPRVLELEVLIRELVSIDGLAAGSIASREVPALFAASGTH